MFLHVFSQKIPLTVLQTELGRITLEIDTVNALITANNFIKHIQKETYKNALFYRAVRPDNQPENQVKIEVIQGGIFSEERLIKPNRHETTKKTGLKHLDGTLSMARAEVGTASTEFFICIGDQPELDVGGKRNPDGHGFVAFGKVLKGMHVVKKIQQLKDENQILVEKVSLLKVE